MDKRHSRARILAFPSGQSPAGGKLDALEVQIHGQCTDLLMDYQELQLTAPLVLFESDGKPAERVTGRYHPRRLCFTNIQIKHGENLVCYFNDLPPHDPARTLTDTLSWRTTGGQNYYLFNMRVVDSALLLIAQHCVAQKRNGLIQPATLTRDWSPAPLARARLVPNPTWLHHRYGGNPITIKLNSRSHLRRLFVGGVDIQGDKRPDVHAILNVGEEASRWSATTPPLPEDRWDNKGEGSEGMGADEIAAEARWVIERLQANKRVLVHCAAGMNRSATICCAVLIILEDISADTALERVREHHPWARPDSHHWLALRWLAHSATKKMP